MLLNYVHIDYGLLLRTYITFEGAWGEITFGGKKKERVKKGKKRKKELATLAK